MTQEEKELLLKDLYARSLYEVKCLCDSGDRPLTIAFLNKGKVHIEEYPQPTYDIDAVMPYLRSMSSMTNEEYEDFKQLDRRSMHRCRVLDGRDLWFDKYEIIDWFNVHHFDYRGLIEKGLALEAPEDMYK